MTDRIRDTRSDIPASAPDRTDYSALIADVAEAIHQGKLSPHEIEPLRLAIVSVDFYGNALAIHELQDRQAKAAAWAMAIADGQVPTDTWEDYLPAADDILHAILDVNRLADPAPPPNPQVAGKGGTS